MRAKAKNDIGKQIIFMYRLEETRTGIFCINNISMISTTPFESLLLSFTFSYFFVDCVFLFQLSSNKYFANGGPVFVPGTAHVTQVILNCV